MDKTEALNKINVLVDQVKHAGPFKGRAKLLNSLNGLHNLINNYKTTKGFYVYITKEAHALVENARDKLNAGS